MRFTGRLMFPFPRDAWTFYRQHGLDLNLDQLGNMWWRLAIGGDC